MHNILIIEHDRLKTVKRPIENTIHNNIHNLDLSLIQAFDYIFITNEDFGAVNIVKNRHSGESGIYPISKMKEILSALKDKPTMP